MDDSTLSNLTSRYPTQEDVIALLTSDAPSGAAQIADIPCVHHILTRRVQ
jgi:hypothetical protein